MPNYTVSGTVWNDADGDGNLDAGEAGIDGRTVELVATADPSVLLDTETTAGGGLYTLEYFNPSGPVFLRARTTPPAGWTNTTATSRDVTLLVTDPNATGIDFGQRELSAVRQCFTRPSSWVSRVCWVPGRGVQVQFKRRGVPYFECYYPGTAFADYQRFRQAPSLGRWAYAFYYRRPYVPVPIGS